MEKSGKIRKKRKKSKKIGRNQKKRKKSEKMFRIQFKCEPKTKIENRKIYKNKKNYRHGYG